MGRLCLPPGMVLHHRFPFLRPQHAERKHLARRKREQGSEIRHPEFGVRRRAGISPRTEPPRCGGLSRRLSLLEEHGRPSVSIAPPRARARGSGGSPLFLGLPQDSADYGWFRDNLDSADGSPRPEDIDARWTFGGSWDPERSMPSSPHVRDAPLTAQRGNRREPGRGPPCVGPRKGRAHAAYPAGENKSRRCPCGRIPRESTPAGRRSRCLATRSSGRSVQTITQMEQSFGAARADSHSKRVKCRIHR